MKIESLAVASFRGLVDFAFECRADSVVISGPNGSGKSAVVDALDFLFTGTISRLRGKGTGQLSLEAHGPHVDHDASDAVVRADVTVGGARFQLERAVSSASQLRITPTATPALAAALSVAQLLALATKRRNLNLPARTILGAGRWGARARLYLSWLASASSKHLWSLALVSASRRSGEYDGGR